MTCKYPGKGVTYLQVWKEGYVPSPLNSTEQQPGGQLANVVYAHDVVRLHTLAVPRSRIRFGAQQQRYIGGQVRVAVESDGSSGSGCGRGCLAVSQAQLTRKSGEPGRLTGWNSTSLHGCGKRYGQTLASTPHTIILLPYNYISSDIYIIITVLDDAKTLYYDELFSIIRKLPKYVLF